MSANWVSKKLTKKSLRSKLAVAITAGLMAGAYAPVAFAADVNGPVTSNETYSENTTINAGTTSAYYGTPEFAGIKITDGDDKLITASGNTLTITAKGNNNDGTRYVGIAKYFNGNTLTIDAQKLVVNVDNGMQGGNSGSAIGIAVEDGGIVHVKNNVNITAQSKNVGGIRAEYGGKVKVDGTVTMKTADGDYGITSTQTAAGNYAPMNAHGIFASGGGSTVDVNAVDLKIDGSGIVTQSNGVVNVGSGRIEIKKQSSDTDVYHYAVYNKGGTVNINKEAVEENVNLIGNIGITGNEVNLTMNTKDSTWDGVVVKTGGNMNLNLANGATWTNQTYGRTDDAFKGSTITNFKGGTQGNEGVIKQLDTNTLTIENYSGEAFILYDNTGNGLSYAGGDTIIKHASGGSVVTLGTARGTINMQDETAVNEALNALAGKLTYSDYVDGQRNLTGKLQIASGLTSSSAEKTAVIAFNKDTGVGTLAETGQTKTEFETTITGDELNDTEYTGANVLRDGVYHFDQDSTIATFGDGIKAIKEVTYLGGGVYAPSGKNITVEAGDNTLNIDIDANTSGNAYGISNTHTSGYGSTADENIYKVNVEAGQLDINVNGTYNVSGINATNNFTTENAKSEINIKGDVNINANDLNTGSYTATVTGVQTMGMAAIVIDGNLNMLSDDGGYGITGTYYKNAGISAQGSYNTTSAITVKGDVNIKVQGTAIYADYNSVANVEGGGLIQGSTTDYWGTKSTNAINAASGTINVNMLESEANSNNSLKVYGNTLVGTYSYGSYYDGTVNLGLSGVDSELKGAFVTTAGSGNLWLQNGATWINRDAGTIDGIGTAATSGFSGSRVTNFHGGDSAGNTGYIYQNDTNGLTIDNYSGNTVIYYAHDLDNEKSGDDYFVFTAGDTTITKAAENSAITLVTSSNGVVFEGDDANHKYALNALAGKLIYSDYANNIDNLKGQVKIASGLTASDITMAIGDITFTETDGGRGTLNQTPPSNETDNNFIANPDTQTGTDFNTTITGGSDLLYTVGGVKDSDSGAYVFTESQSNIKVEGKVTADENVVAAINATNDITIKANSSVDTDNNVTDGKRLTVSATDTATAFEGAYAAGINNTVTDKNITIGGNQNENALWLLDVDAVSENNNAYGIYVSGTENNTNGTLGDKESQENEKGITAFGYIRVNADAKAEGKEAIAVYAGENSYAQLFGTVNITGGNEDIGLYANGDSTGNANIAVIGSTDIQVAGTAVEANNGKVVIKGYQHTTGEDQHYTMNIQGENALYAHNGGTIEINDNNSSERVDSVTITGNVKVVDADSSIKMYLNDANSMLSGMVIDDETSDGVTMELKNGAVWNHMNAADVTTFADADGSYVKNFNGGTEGTAGYIVQGLNAPSITIGNYDGRTVVYYEHSGDGSDAEKHYGGAFKIDAVNTNDGSQSDSVVLITSAKDVTNTTETLTALASKLWVKEEIKNNAQLNGSQVKIASGLTASGATLAMADIKFTEDKNNEDYYQGTIGQVDDDSNGTDGDQTEVNFTSTITGDVTNNLEYKAANVIKKDDKGNDIYKFTQDSTITTDAFAVNTIHEKTGTFGDNDLEGKDVNIDASGTTLNFKVTGNNAVNGGNAVGVKNNNDLQNIYDHVNNVFDVNIKADTLNIEASGSGYVGGINSINVLNANERAEVNVESDVNIIAVGENQAVAGLYAAANAEINVIGDVTMKADDGDYGVKGESRQTYGIAAESNLTYGEGDGFMPSENIAGTVKVDGNVNLKVQGVGVYANGGSVEITGGGSIEGATRNYYGSDYTNAVAAYSGGEISINMNGDEPNQNQPLKLYGNVTSSGTNSKDGKASSVTLGLSGEASELNGAVIDSDDGATTLYLQNGATWNNQDAGIIDGLGTTATTGFEGSCVTTLVGGASKAESGFIMQNDERPLTIDNYSGYTVIAFDHVGDGSSKEEIKGGDVTINTAAAGSGIVLSTSRKGIETNNDAKVESTLMALANKLTYTANDGNLKGEVQIAEGLTASSQSVKLGDMTFDEATGVGQYEAGSLRDVTIRGKEETYMMQGARLAMTTSMLAWRETAGDIYSRAEEIRRGNEKGTWARAYGGKTEYNGNNTSFENSYYAAQVGWDKQVQGGWNYGVAVDYMDGDAKYLMGGEGDNSLYAIGFYGTKDLGKNTYIDLAAKFGKLDNDFEVYNEIGEKLEGSYDSRGIGFSAKVGKRFGNEAKGYLEPSVQFTYAKVDDAEFDATSGGQSMNIKQDAFESLVGKIGVQAGIEKANHGFYAKLGVAHEFAGDVEGTYSAYDGGTKRTSYDLSDTWTELTIGGHYNMSKNSYFFADITRTLSGDYENEWKLNAGVQFTF